MATCIREVDCGTIAASRLPCVGSLQRFQIEPFAKEPGCRIFSPSICPSVFELIYLIGMF